MLLLQKLISLCPLGGLKGGYDEKFTRV